MKKKRNRYDVFGCATAATRAQRIILCICIIRIMLYVNLSILANTSLTFREVIQPYSTLKYIQLYRSYTVIYTYLQRRHIYINIPTY